MRKPHTIVSARALVLSSVLFLMLLAVLAFAYAPTRAAGRTLAAQLIETPVATRLLALMPASMRAAVSTRLPKVYAAGHATTTPAKPSAPGAVIMVTTTDQEVNSDSDCSLQEAIFSANFDSNIAINPNSLNGTAITTGCTPGSGDDTIVLQASATYQTNGTVASGAQNGVAQDQFSVPGLAMNPRVSSTITIEGNGAKLELVGGQTVRAFVVSSGTYTVVTDPTTMPPTEVAGTGTGNLTIRDLHIKGFKTKGGDSSDGGGGGLGAGGAIYVNAGAGSLGTVLGTPSLTIERCTFEGNTATGGNGGADSAIAGGGGGGGMGGLGGNDVAVGAGNGGGGGGGVRGRGGNGPDSGGGGGGTALNGVNGAAGGVGGNGGFNCGGKGGDFPNGNANAGFCAGGAGGGGAQGTGAGVNGGAGGAGNYGGGGGGGGASSQATGGTGGAGGFGGGGGAGGAGGNGGNGGFGGGGGGAGNSGVTNGIGGLFAGSAGSGNGGGGAGLGAAIFNDSGTVTIRNSTFFNNSTAAGLAGGPGAANGTASAAVFSRNGSLTILHSTFSNNTADNASDIHVFGDGTDANIEVRNTILANPSASVPDCRLGSLGGGYIASFSGNLIETNTSGTCPGPLSAPDPGLGPLQLNAPGNTPTMAITNSSPAFNTADGATSLASDQRGVPRPQAVSFDIGAYEAKESILADLGVSKTSTSVVDPDGAGPLAPVPLPIVGPNVPPGSVNAGGYIRYDVPFGNAGPDDAENVRLTDVIPSNTAFVGALATGGVYVPAAQPPAVPFTFTIPVTKAASPNISFTCTVAGAAGNQQITCSVGNGGFLPPGYTGTLTFFVRVNESVTGGTVVSNPANITSAPSGSTPATPDPNPGNNTSLPTSTVVIASSNLSVSKIVQSAVTVASNPNQTGPIGPATPPNGAIVTGTAVVPGTYLTYRVFITNNGPSDVVNVRLTDVLPSGLETPPGRVLGVKYILVAPVLPSGATFTCAPPTGVNPSNNPQGNGGSVVCTAPVLTANAPNNTAAIDVTVFIDPATKANLVNTATVDATISNFNRPVSGSTTLTTPVQPISDLTLTKTADPTVVFPSTNVVYTLTVKNNGPSVAAMVNVVDPLPAGQSLVSADVTGAPGFTCSGTTTVTCSAAALAINETAVIKLTVLVGAGVAAGNYINTATASSMSIDPTLASASATITVILATPPGVGLGFPAASEISDQKAGSVLFYPFYISDAANPNSQNTRFSITNVSGNEQVCVHLFAVDGSSCSVLDVFICLTPNQTAAMLMSDFDPGASGYLVAVAVDCATGLPTAANVLIGDESFKMASGYAANVGAEAISALRPAPAGNDTNASTAVLQFDGTRYNRLPRVLAVSNIPGPNDDNSTLFILNRVGGNFVVAGDPIGAIAGQLFDDAEQALSFTANLPVCQYRKVLDSTFPRTFNPFTRFIGAGRTGWMKFYSAEDRALLGLTVNLHANPRASAGGFSQGHNMHKLRMTEAARIILPIYLPSCL